MEKTVNNTTYKVLKDEDGVLYVSARTGANSVNVVFCCLKIEWESDFDMVRQILKDIIINSSKYI